MNKKYSIYALLFLFFISNIECSSFQKAQDQAIVYAFNTALLSGALYFGGKVVAKYKESTLPDAPPHFQKWARAILAENGLKDADSVPLKIGQGSCVTGGSFIQIDSSDANRLEDVLAGRSQYSDENQKRIRAYVEKTLLHEKKHYYNGDFGKGCLLFGATAAFGFQVITKNDVISAIIKNDDVLVFQGALLTGGVCATIATVPYKRYKEKEADRYAFMHISSLEKLEITKRIFEENAQAFETNLLTKPLSGQHNLFSRQLRPMIADRWYILNRDIAIASPEEQVKIGQRKRNLVEVASFVSDWQHPSYKSAAELAQECIDIRKATYQKKFKSSVSAMLRAQGIKQ